MGIDGPTSLLIVATLGLAVVAAAAYLLYRISKWGFRFIRSK